MPTYPTPPAANPTDGAQDRSLFAATLPSHGLSEAEVLAQLEGMRGGDLDHRSGRAFAYTYDAGQRAERVGKAAYTAYLTENALDPTSFPSLLRFERDIVAMVADHLHAPTGTVGSFTSGGTESILCAVKAARDFTLAKRKGAVSGASQPLEMVLPTTAHAAFHKAASYFGLRKVLVPVDPLTFAAVPAAMEAAITPQTALIVGSTPSYAHGVIDPVTALGEIALRHDVLFHVDACVGGFLLPFWRKSGANVPVCDLSVPGVTSLSVDLHKYAFCPKGASLVFHTRAEIQRAQYFACSSWSGYTVVNPTVQSSKSGGPMAAAWSVLRHIGADGYAKIAETTHLATQQLVEGIGTIDGLEILGRPDFCMVAAKASPGGPSVFAVCDEMKKLGWYVQAQFAFGHSPENIHFSLHPGNAGRVPEMVVDLAKAVEAARAFIVDEALISGVCAMFGASTEVPPTAIEGLLRSAGITSEGGLPDAMAPVNHLLNALPPTVREQLIAGFMQTLYR